MKPQRVCLLTGASGRLGSAFCRLYSDRYQIAAVYRRHLPSRASQLQQFVDPLAPDAKLPENACQVFAIRSDLSCPGETERVTELVLAKFGRIDLLINGAVCSRWAPVIESTSLLDTAMDQFLMNVVVPLRLAATVARKFWRDRGAENSGYNRNIVNVSSTAGVFAYPNSGQTVYSASKAALNLATMHIGSEFAAFGVRANAIAPNSFPSIIPTEEVAAAVHRLDQGKRTGEVIVLDSDGEWTYAARAALKRTRGKA